MAQAAILGGGAMPNTALGVGIGHGAWGMGHRAYKGYIRLIGYTHGGVPGIVCPLYPERQHVS